MRNLPYFLAFLALSSVCRGEEDSGISRLDRVEERFELRGCALGQCQRVKTTVVSHGTAFCVHYDKETGEAIYATAAHNLDGPGSLAVGIKPARKIAAKKSDGYDIALVAVRRDCPRIWSLSAKKTGSATVTGWWGARREWTEIRGRYRTDRTWIWIDRPAYQGVSGGPVIDSDGSVVGVLSGTTVDESIAQSATVLERLLDETYPNRNAGKIEVSPTPIIPTPVSPTPVASCDEVERKLRDLDERVTCLLHLIEGLKQDTNPSRNASDTAEIGKLKKRLETLENMKFPLRILKEDGSVFSESTVRLGEPIELRLVPKKKEN